MATPPGLLPLTTLRLLLVSGKGGVGKTSVAAALAARAARDGRRVLLVSTDGRGDAAAFFGGRDAGYRETELAPGLSGLTAGYEDLLADFVTTTVPVRLISSRILGSATFRYFTRAAPGLADLLLLGKVREILRAPRRTDLVVIDAPATGHALTLIRVPRALLDTIPAGPLRKLALDLSRLLGDPSHSALVVVAEPAELAAREAEELIAGARDLAGLSTALVVVNRVGRSGRSETLPRIAVPVLRVPELDVASPDSAAPFTADVAFFAAFCAALEQGEEASRRGAPAATPLPRGSLDLAAFVARERLVVLVGPGGVGKTTLAAATGIAAARAGKRTLVITVDPARRLAQALGLEGALDHPVAVPLPGAASLHVMQVDPKASFERLLARVASPATLARIHANRMYSGFVDTLPGVVEYMGVEALAEHASDPDVDLLVLDTAPAARGIDFLKAPDRMVELLDNDALRWFLKSDSLLSRALSGASRGASFLLHHADKALGFGFLGDLADFFRAFEGLYDGFRERSREISRLLRASAYLVVTSADRSALRTAAELATLLPCPPDRVGLLVNRVPPAAAHLAIPPALAPLPRRLLLESGGEATSLPYDLARELGRP